MEYIQKRFTTFVLTLFTFLFLPLTVAQADATSTFASDSMLTAMHSPIAEQSYAYDEDVIFEIDWRIPEDYTVDVRIYIDDFGGPGSEVYLETIDTTGAGTTTTGTILWNAGNADTGTELYQFGGDHNTQVTVSAIDGVGGSVFQAYEFRPYTVDPVPVPLLALLSVPDPADFVDVVALDTQQGQFLIKNVGGAPVEGTAQITAGADKFSFDGGDSYLGASAIQPGDTQVVDFTFDPDGDVGSYIGQFVFTCDNCIPSMAIPSNLTANSKLLTPADVGLYYWNNNTIYPGPMVFGTFPVDQPERIRTLKLKNDGELPLSGDITFSPDTGQYSCTIDGNVGDCSYDGLAPGAYVRVDIHFDPDVHGPDNVVINFSAEGDGASGRSINATGGGIAEPILNVQDQWGTNPPASSYNIPGTFHLENTTTGPAWQRHFYVRNVGAGTMSGAVTGVTDGFECIAGCTYTNLVYGGIGQWTTLQFNPPSTSTAGVHTASIQMSNAASSTDTVNFNISATVNDLPIITLTRSNWLIPGTINVGSTPTVSFDIINSGAKTLTGELTGLGDGFECVSGCSYSLAGGTAQTVVLQFNSAAAGDGFHSIMAVFENDQNSSNNVNFPMSASVNDSPVAEITFLSLVNGNVDFQTVLVGDERTLRIASISNSGVGTATVNVTGTTSVFDCVPSTACYIEIPQGQTHDLYMKFTAEAPVGDKTAGITITAAVTASSTVLSGTTNMTLVGESFRPILSVTPTTESGARPVDFGTVNAGTPPKVHQIGAMNLDGSGDFGLTDLYPPGGSGDYTYAAWVRRTDSIGHDTVFMGSNGGGGNTFLLMTRPTSISVYEGSERIAYSANNDWRYWRHLVVRKSAGTISLYRDGQWLTAVPGVSLNFNSCRLLIGVDADSVCYGGLSEYFKGQIGDVRVYNRALTSNEIAELANMSVGDEDTVPNRVAHWTFAPDTVSGSFVDDVSGAGKTLQLYGNAYVSQYGTFELTNIGPVNYGDQGVYLGPGLSANLDAEAVLEGSPYFTCVSGCNAGDLDGLAPNGPSKSVVLSFTPGVSTMSVDEMVYFRATSTADASYAVSRTRYVRATSNADSELHVEAGYASSSPPGVWVASTTGMDVFNSGDVKEMTFYVSNTGAGTLVGTATVSNIVGTVFECVDSLGDGCTYSLLNDGSVHKVVLRATAVGDGGMTGQVEFSDLFTGNNMVVDLEADVNVSPIISILEVTGSHFGTVSALNPGDGLIKDFVITNVGVGPLSGSLDGLDAPFYCLENCTYLLPAGQSTTTKIEYRPTANAFQSDTAVFTGASGAPITFSGTGYLQPVLSVNPSGSFYSFGTILAGETRHKIFELSNAGHIGSNVSGEITTEDPFSCDPCSYNVDPITPDEIDVVYAPPISSTSTLPMYISGRTNPRAYISFDDPDANYVSKYWHDRSGSGRDAQYIGSGVIATSSGPFGEAASLNSISEYLLPTFAPDKAITISTWLRSPNTTWAGGQPVWKDRGYTIRTEPGTKTITFRVYKTATAYEDIQYTSTQDIRDWHHYVVTYEHGSAQIFEDGVLVASRNNMTTTDMNDMGGGVYLSHGAYAGGLDEVALYNRTLSATEVQDLYLNGEKIQVILDGTRIFAPVLNVSLTSTDFGKVRVGETKDLVFEFRNSGTGVLGPGDMYIDGGDPFSCVKTMSSSTIDSWTPPIPNPGGYTSCEEDPDCGDPLCPYEVDGGSMFRAIVRFAPQSIGVFSRNIEFSTLPGVPLGIVGEGYIPSFIYQEF